MCPDRRDRGSATIWLLGLVFLIGQATAVGIVSGSAILARHRAETAADLAALAAAVQVSRGESDACAVARMITEANTAQLSRCVVAGGDVEVAVTRPLTLGRLGSWMVTARARAGPADRTAR